MTFTCEAAVQASHKLMWTVGGTQTDATREEMINYKRGKRSVLVLPITKELNGKTVECYVKDSDSPSKTSVNKTLDVKGEYGIFFLYLASFYIFTDYLIYPLVRYN